MAFEQLLKKRRGTHGTVEGVLLSCTSANRSKKHKCLCVRFAGDIMRKCRWKPGDCIVLELDRESKLLRCSRTPDATLGFKLVPTHHGSKTGACWIKATAPEWVPAIFPPGTVRFQADYCIDADSVTVDF
jgi:hypothetical protein